jgi:deoxyribose-phosphate aldolase
MKPLNKYFDHTLLKAEATIEQIITLCAEAREYDFYSVCVNTCYVPLAVSELKDTDIKVAAVVGFPLGAMSTEAKAYETDWACEKGASEVDMVINIGAIKSRDAALATRDIRGVVATAHAAGALVKVIIETCLLTDEEKVLACLLSKEAGADFVKTSTGFSTGGATVHDIELMRSTVGPSMGVKASGGIHSLQDAESMIKAGASRIGASAGVKIIQEMNQPAPQPATPQPVAIKAY